MSNNKDTVDASEAAAQNSREHDDAVGEAAEAIAGAQSEDSVQQDENNNDGSGGTSDVEQVRAERDRYFEHMRRAQAELENYRRRVQRESEQAAKYTCLPLIRDLLPALDNLGRTVQAAEQTGKINDLVQGLEMVLAQFDQIFANHAAKPIPAEGEPFDPNLHEAMQQVPTNEHPPMTIIQEVERGYVLHDRVIRPSKVIVASTPAENSQRDEEQQS